MYTHYYFFLMNCPLIFMKCPFLVLATLPEVYFGTDGATPAFCCLWGGEPESAGPGRPGARGLGSARRAPCGETTASVGGTCPVQGTPGSKPHLLWFPQSSGHVRRPAAPPRFSVEPGVGVGVGWAWGGREAGRSFPQSLLETRSLPWRVRGTRCFAGLRVLCVQVGVTASSPPPSQARARGAPARGDGCAAISAGPRGSRSPR